MPRAPRKCAGLGCETRITNTRYCPEHTTWHWSPTTTKTAAHKAWAKGVLMRANYMCEIKGPNCLIRATEADHKTPEAEGGKTTPSNGQAACTECHKEKTQAEATRGQRRTTGKHEEKPPF